MKKRRTLIISLLLVAAIALGVGYAAISGNLAIQGKVVSKAQPFNVHFVKFTPGTAHSVLNNSPAIACDTVLTEAAPAKSIMLNVSGMSTGASDDSGADRDTVSAVITIKNENDTTMDLDVQAIQYGASLNALTNTPSEYFKVDVAWKDNVKTLAPDETTEITVTVTMIQSCVDEFTEYFQITLVGNNQVTAP